MKNRKIKLYILCKNSSQNLIKILSKKNNYKLCIISNFLNTIFKIKKQLMIFLIKSIHLKKKNTL